MTATAASPKLSDPEAVRRFLGTAKVVALDLETTGLNPRRDRVRLLTLNDSRTTVILDCFQHDPRPLLPLLKDKIVVAHNAGFDLGFLWHLGLHDLPETICTYLAAQVLTAGEGNGDHGFPPLGLGACCQRWLGRTLSKELQASDWSGRLSNEQLAYARDDVAVLLPLLKRLNEGITSHELHLAADIEMRSLRAFIWMAQSGVPFDRESWKDLADTAATQLADLEEKLNKLAPHKGAADLFGERPRWNWASPQQVAQVLSLLGCSVPSTNDYYLSECSHPIGEVLRKHRESAKRCSTYGHDWLSNVAGDGRVYPGWRQLGAASGRTSCGSPNMQQLPRDGGYKTCVKALEGRSLIKADYSQIELRLACKIARERRMYDAYQAGQDLHSLTAALLLGKSVDQVTKGDRQIAKSANFGLLYGMGGPGYRAYAKATYGLDMTEDQAWQYRRAFFQAYPGLDTWHARTKREQVKETRTVAGRRRLMPSDAPDTWRLNTPVQGSGADGLKLSLALLWERRAQCPNAAPVLAVHDEIVVECPTAEVESTRAWLVKAMEDGMRPFVEPVPVAVDVKVTQTWGG